MRSRVLPACPTCGLIAGLCACAWLETLEAETEVVVVMHRLEQHRRSNTGKLAAHVLATGTVVVREGPAEPEREPTAGSYVLFPNAGAVPIEAAKARGLLRLVVPDGTWPQAGRIARRDPLCSGLPSVSLAPSRRSIYDLRRSDRPHALSTFEAIAEALRVLEGDTLADRMHAVFARWVDDSQRVRRGALTQPTRPRGTPAPNRTTP